jgi:hypothetical protein
MSKAQEIEAMASGCPDQATQDRFLLVASRWRSVAAMAQQQDYLALSLPTAEAYAGTDVTERRET